jgi:hypothetical protein
MQTKTKVALAAALFGSAAVAIPVVIFWGRPEVRGDGGQRISLLHRSYRPRNETALRTPLPEARQSVAIPGDSNQSDTAPAGNATESQPPSSVSGVRAATMLEVSAGSFLTATPDFASFEEAVATLAKTAEVDAKTVHRNVEDGSINGKLTVPGSDLVGSFKIMGDRYSINLEPSPGIPLPAPFGFRNITVSFLEEQGT